MIIDGLSKTKAFTRKSFVFHAAMFILCVAVAFIFRSAVCSREIARVKTETGANFAPFFVESAIMYGYVQDIADGKGIPEYDPALPSAGKYRVSEQMSLGLEYFLGYGLQLRRHLLGIPDDKTPFEKSPAETSWIRGQIRAWVCLLPGFIYLWLIFSGCNWLLAVAGALLYAVAPSAVARYTGQDLLKGEFALPLLAAMFAFASYATRKSGIAAVALTVFFAFCATATWDASQFVIGIWGLWEIVHWCLYGKNPRRRNIFIVIYCALLLSAVLVPYNRAHGFILSPVILMIWPVLIILHFCGGRSFGGRVMQAVLFSIAGMLLWQGINFKSVFAANYSHFASLAKAKLLYLNSKPLDPEALNFEQRFMWTPSLNSATWDQTRAMFPLVLWLLMLLPVLGIYLNRTSRRVIKGFKRSIVPLGMTLTFFGFYIFFFRFHVFCALFMAVAFPLLLDDWRRSILMPPARMVLILLIFGAVIYEGATTWKLRRSYPAGFLRESSELIHWFRESGCSGKVMLGDLAVSPLLKGYCDASIIIQPKFEIAEIRNQVKDYIMLMFHGTEHDFADYCSRNKVDFIVFDRGTAGSMHKYSYRYMAAAKKLSFFSCAVMMEQHPDKLKYFFELTPPKKFQFLRNRYRVFKFISPEKKKTARFSAELAMLYYRKGNLLLARKLARAAFYSDPKSDQAALTYYKIFKKAPGITLQKLCR
ncbi:hypothetical protein P0136_05010 [Lentisphaerota bacterium ZTH]|nr:hypothetical protein JYG24_03870 [Lentisphaerota bacterium]WET07350.1 hypothetical protein P0136_05010 [Lentisphaerota bacterium ZTH]